MHRVLVVEDDGDMQDLLFRWFRGNSSTVEATLVASAEAALERLAAGSYETLLTDVFLPGIDGVELLLTARRLYPSIRVVVMSAFGSPELEAAVLDSGALRFIRKPIDFAEHLVDRTGVRALRVIVVVGDQLSLSDGRSGLGICAVIHDVSDHNNPKPDTQRRNEARSDEDKRSPGPVLRRLHLIPRRRLVPHRFAHHVS